MTNSAEARFGWSWLPSCGESTAPAADGVGSAAAGAYA